jgi:hypothetical protein
MVGCGEKRGEGPLVCFYGAEWLKIHAARRTLWQLRHTIGILLSWDLAAAAAARKFESTVPYFTGVPVVRFSGLRSSRGLGLGLGDLVQQVHEPLNLDAAPIVTALCLGHKIWLAAAFSVLYSKERRTRGGQSLQIMSADKVGIRITPITSTFPPGLGIYTTMSPTGA